MNKKLTKKKTKDLLTKKQNPNKKKPKQRNTQPPLKIPKTQIFIVSLFFWEVYQQGFLSALRNVFLCCKERCNIFKFKPHVS